MPTRSEGFVERLAQLRGTLVAQGRLVVETVEAAFEAVYLRDAGAAKQIADRDDVIDQADLEIELAALDMLAEATRDGAALSPAQLRGVLTVVKVNNELERIADAACAVAEKVVALSDRTTPFPKTTRVLTNSVVGILQDAVTALSEMDPHRAKVVLASEGAVLNFNDLILRDAEQRVADGRMSVDLAFDLHAIVSQSVLIADHCTNVAEQIIYEATGKVVRHTKSGWVELPITGSDKA